MKNRQIFVLLTIVAMTLITSCKHEGSLDLLLLLDENNIVKQCIQAGKYTDEKLLRCISSNIE